MAYYNANGQVTIDEAAANSDIQKIRQAIQKLEESKQSIAKLQGAASAMRGQTGEAVVEQCVRLNKQAGELVSQLNGSIQYIRKTVEKYKEEDRQVALRIRSGGGV